jgi:phenylacetate-CoA ligase
LSAIEGRVDDVLYTRDGRVIGRLDPIFKSGLPIREAQIVQEALDRIRVRYVPAPEFTQKDSESLVARIRDRMGSVQVALEEIDSIPRSTNGKFRAVVCNLSPEERQHIKSIA